MWSTPEVEKENSSLCDAIRILKLKIELEQLTQQYDKLLAVRKDTSKCENVKCKGHKPKSIVTNGPKFIPRKVYSNDTEWIPSLGPLSISPTESEIEVERKKCEEIYGKPRFE